MSDKPTPVVDVEAVRERVALLEKGGILSSDIGQAIDEMHAKCAAMREALTNLLRYTENLETWAADNDHEYTPRNKAVVAAAELLRSRKS